jgi:hypothetical protein
MHTRTDTSLWTSHTLCLARTKRTHNLPDRTVALVRELSTGYGVADTQDAVVELAVDELARRLRESEEAHAWATAPADQELVAEVQAIEREFASADAETWPAE